MLPPPLEPQTTAHPAFNFVRFVFGLFDEDRSGTLDMDELKGMLRQMLVPMSRVEFARAVEWVDADESGVLDVEEFIVLFCFLESGMFPAGHEPPEEWWEGLQRPVARRDGDDDDDDKDEGEDLDEDEDEDEDGNAALGAYSPAGETGDEGEGEAREGEAGLSTAPLAAAATVAAAAGSPGSGGSPARRVQRSGAQKVGRSLAKAAMQTSDAWKLFVTRQSVHHYLARRVLTREACIAAGKQVHGSALGAVRGGWV
jgi:hypothetical protein